MRNEPFELGICMAGAVSAGAYTAGVMDFLIEALDTWEQKRGEKMCLHIKLSLKPLVVLQLVE
jgi:hypothetical protein